MKTITFNELRKIKDKLPDGSIRRIAAELELPEETVRNYFGGVNQSTGNGGGIHIEPGPDGGIVMFDDPMILEKALIILGETDYNVSTVFADV
ncbi:MAG: DNA-binding protein [Candidatus Azobacteroides sp.]|nr:DNA-binding protein [Candidatus Azobacteroides sp.]